MINDKIVITKNEYRFSFSVYAILTVLSAILAGNFVVSSFSTFRMEGFNSFLALLSDLLIIIICIMVAKWSFTELVSVIRFFGLNLRITDEKLVLYTSNKKCEILLTKDLNVTFSMFGWLLVWRSGNESTAVLIRNSLYGTRYLKLASYFDLKTNLISSSVEKRRMLKRFHINIFNPLKYIKWPAGNENRGQNRGQSPIF